MPMRISRIGLQNYRQFRKVNLSLEKKLDADLHILIGRNTAGKTNILNAVNWCLYGEEPHVTAQYRGLPVPNLAAVNETADGKELHVAVEIAVMGEEMESSVFRRQSIFRVHRGNNPTLQRTSFQVRYPDEQGNTKILENEEANEHVQRFVPVSIREFFFFDGERLDNYFREEAGQRILHAVFEISQIDLLDRIGRKLGDLERDLEKQAASISPALEEIRKELEDSEKAKEELNARLGECEKQLHSAEEKVTEYTQKLAGLPDIEKVEKEREALTKQIEDFKPLLANKEHDKFEILFEYGVQLNVQEAMLSAIEVIEEKRNAGEIPPAITPEILEDSLKKGSCVICKAALTTISKRYIKELLKDIQFSSEIAHELHRVEGPLRMLITHVSQFEKSIKAVTNEIQLLREQVISFQAEREKIDNQLSGYDIEKVRQWASSRRDFEQTARQLREKKGALRAALESKDREVASMREKLRKEMKAQEKAKEIQRQIEYCLKAKCAAEKAKQSIMTRTRSCIEQRTYEIFMELVWRRATYEGLKIDENYNISLYHSMGYDALGTVSAAERELLALSFTLALHEISGFEGPLLIDTPLARVSDQHRENFAKALLRVATTGKQILLLFTPDEYTSNVSKWLESKAVTRRELRLQQNERETKAEDL